MIPFALGPSPWLFLMATSIGSERSPPTDKEDTSDIHRLHGYDSEKNQAADPKVLQRATLKIDFYLIPVVGTLCIFFLPFISSFCR
jgi:hypothetical protein